jgi:hypothetical protein
MTLRERLVDDMKSAMKAKDELKLSAIRMVRSSVKNREIDLRKELTDQEVTEVIASLAKQRRESIKLFQEAGRTDLVDKEERELNFLLQYLPQQLDRQEIEKIVANAIAESGATCARDMGRVMKVVIPRIAGRADGKMVNEIVKEKLL